MSAIQRAMNPVRLVPRLHRSALYNLPLHNHTRAVDVLACVNGVDSALMMLGKRGVTDKECPPKLAEGLLKEKLAMVGSAVPAETTGAHSNLGKAVWDRQYPKPLHRTSMTEGSLQIAPGSRHSW